MPDNQRPEVDTQPASREGASDPEPATSRIDLIHAAARHQFAERGYEGASMRAIAAEAGITISTLFFHCGSKEQLLFQVLEDSMQRLLQGLREAVDAAGRTWAERLAAAIAFHVQFCARGDFGAAINVSELRALKGDLRVRIVALRDEYERQFHDLISGGIAAGEFAAVDAKLIAVGIIGIGLTVGRFYQPGGRLTAEEIAAEYTRFTFRGLRPDPVAGTVGANGTARGVRRR